MKGRFEHEAVSGPREAERPEVVEVRSRLLDRVMLPILALGFLAALFGAVQSYQQGRWWFSIVYLGLYLVVLSCTVFRRQIPFSVRASVLLTAFLLVSVAILLRIGLSGVGLLGMIATSVLAAVLVGTRAGFVTLGLCILAAVLIALGMVSGRIPIYPEHMLTSISPLQWLIALIVFIMNTLGLILIPQMFVARLKESLELVERRTLRLKRSNEVLRREIKTRREAERALKESEEKYRLVVDNANEGIILTQTGKVIFLNQRAMDQAGYYQDEFSRKNMAEFIHPEDREEAIRRYLRILAGEELKDDYEYRIIDGRGNTRWLKSHSVLVDWMGEPAVITFMNEITQRKEAEAEKEKLQARLQRAQKMEAIGTLAGGVAHDLNNILSGIVSYPDLLLIQLPEESPLRKPVMTMRESGKRAAAIVQDLLTLARRGVATTEVVNLNTVVKDYLQSPEHEKLRSLHPDVEVRTELDGHLLNVVGSPVHLQKTVMNLVSNALEAMPGGGTIRISTENHYMDRPLSGYDRVLRGDYVVLTVSDTGIGIAPEDRERIFEPFYTRKVMGRSGTGLGMAVVWGTVKDHEGFIDVESAEGRGTTFALYFPGTRRVEGKESPPFSAQDYQGKGESILVVDDMQDQRDIASTLLGQMGYSVSAVSSGEEAVEHVKKRPVDLLVLDMIMDPGMDGLDTYREILKIRPEQRAILASGYSETDRVREAQRLGAGRYIRKPYTLEGIGMAVRRELDRERWTRDADGAVE